VSEFGKTAVTLALPKNFLLRAHVVEKKGVEIWAFDGNLILVDISSLQTFHAKQSNKV
jgi:hypothetical protein